MSDTSSTSNLSGSYDLEMMLIPREVVGYVEAMTAAHPDIGCYSLGSLYEDIIWDDEASATTYTQEYIDQLRIDVTKELWIMLLATEANDITDEALKLHTESHNSLQKQVYDLKYQDAIVYKESLEAASDPTAVSPPPMIARECEATGEDPIALMTTIIENYLTSNYVLGDYIGILEGTRRTSKAVIQACTTKEELENLEWPQWLLFSDYMATLQAQQST